MHLIALFPLLVIVAASGALAVNESDCGAVRLSTEQLQREIAGLILEKDALTGTGKAVLRTLVEANINEKLFEFSRRGLPQPTREELQLWVTRLQKQSAADAAVIAVEKVKQSALETDWSATITTEAGFDREAPSRTLPMNAEKIDGDTFFGGEGVRWSEDERYVMIRELAYPARIYDTVAGDWLEFKSRTGFISKTGGLYVDFQDKVKGMGDLIVTNLATGVTYGPFDGEMRSEFFTADYLVTANFHGGTTAASTLRIFSTGESVELKYRYRFSMDGKRVAYETGGEIRVLEAATGKILGKFPADENLIAWQEREGDFFSFRRGTSQFLVHFSNLKEIEIPLKFIPDHLSPNGRYLISTRQWNGDHRMPGEVRGLDLQTGKVHEYGAKTLPWHKAVSKEGMILWPEADRSAWSWFDFDTLTLRLLDDRYALISPNGKWLWGYWEKGKEVRYHYLHREDGTRVERQVHGNLIFAGNSDALYLKPYSKNPGPTKLIDLRDEQLAVDLGDTNVGASPSGRFLVVLRGTRVEIVRIKY